MSAYDDDDIYFFGFSRGAYVARFLAEMLDHVGLLSQGNEEMARFAWKAFSQWQEREESTDEEKDKKKEMLNFLRNFRATFSRPVRRIRFLGLFDSTISPETACSHETFFNWQSQRSIQSPVSKMRGCKGASSLTPPSPQPKSFVTQSVLTSEGPNFDKI